MSYITQQVVGEGYEAQDHDTISEAVLAIAHLIAEHIGEDPEKWVNCHFTGINGETQSTITISNNSSTDGL